MFELVGRAHAAKAAAATSSFQGTDFSTLLNPLKSDTMASPSVMIVNVLQILVFAAGALAVGFLIFGGILYITAGGDAEKATKGKTAVINSVIGIVIVLLALVIVTWVKSLIQATPVL